MTSPPYNPLYRVGVFADQLVQAHDTSLNFARHFEGDEAEMVQRWAGSAVKFKAGGMGVVPIANPMSGQLVVVHEGGTFSGRRQGRALAWFVDKVEWVCFASLMIETDGVASGGASSQHGANTNLCTVCVLPAREAPADGMWDTRLMRGTTTTPADLAGALTPKRALSPIWGQVLGPTVLKLRQE